MSDRPTKALVLAAGYGTRMRPLTDEVPKPLMPLWNRPLLDHCLDFLATWGVADVLVNTHHLPESIAAHVRSHPREDMCIELSYEPEILGTGGAVANAHRFLGDEPFWVVNADIAADVAAGPFLDRFSAFDCLGVLWMHAEQGPRTVEMEGDRIVNFRSANPGAPDTFTFCGIQLLSPDILRYIPRGEFSTIVEAHEKAMRDGRPVHGIAPAQCYWADMGTPAQYLDAHRDVKAAWERQEPGARLFAPEALERVKDVRRQSTRVSGFAALASDVAVVPGAEIRDSVLWEGATVAGGASVGRAIAGRGAVLIGRVKGVAVRPAALGFPALGVTLSELGWDTSATTALPLAPRGSNRCFARLQSGSRRAMAIHYSLERPENAFFVPNARFLKNRAVPVPDVLLDRPEQCLTIVQDLGDRSLQEAAAGASPETVERLYRSVLDAVARIHANTSETLAQAGVQLGEPMSPGVLEWERGYFADNFVARYPGADASLVGLALQELVRVSRTLEQEPEVLIHRDLQSSNVLLTDEDTQIWLIDFQGMRLGPAAYDVASLLCDPYVSLGHELQMSLLRYYAEHAPSAVGPIFWTAAVQRLVQALGAFAKLGKTRDTARFGNHLVPGIRMLLRALDFVDNLSHLRGLLCYALNVEGGDDA